MAILKAPILCDCTGRAYCASSPKCFSNPTGVTTYPVYDCRTGASCGTKGTACNCVLY